MHDGETIKDYRLKHLIELSRSENWVEQKDAAKRLGDLGLKEAIPALVDLLGHEIVVVKIQAARSLGRIGDPSSLPALRFAAGSAYAEVRTEVLEVLSWTPDPENLQVIVSSIFDEDRDVRIAAAECLRRHLEWLDARGGLDENVDDIIGLTTRVFDNSLELQPFYGRILKIVARYLGTTGKRRVIEALITIASKGLPSTRAAGLRALGKMKVRKARPLFTKGLKSGHSGIRFASIDGLGALGYADTVPELMKALEQTNDREEQHMIGLALAKTGSEEAETALLELLGNRKLSAKIIACNFLGEMKSDRALVPLTTLFMKSKNKRVRDAAANAIARIGDSSSVDDLLDVFSRGDSHLRSVAARILGAIGEKNALETLAVAMDRDMDENVRKNAEDALFWILGRLDSEGDIGDSYFIESILPKFNEEMRIRFKQLSEKLKNRTKDPIIMDYTENTDL